MKPDQFGTEMYQLQKVAINALGVIPRESFYRTWCYKLIGDSLKARNYPKLKARLSRFVEENGMQDRYPALAEGAQWTS